MVQLSSIDKSCLNFNLSICSWRAVVYNLKRFVIFVCYLHLTNRYHGMILAVVVLMWSVSKWPPASGKYRCVHLITYLADVTAIISTSVYASLCIVQWFWVLVFYHTKGKIWIKNCFMSLFKQGLCLKKSNKHLVILLKVGSHAFSDYICPHFELKLPLFFHGM